MELSLLALYTKIAEVCHEANRAYRIAMNEPEKDGYSLLHWDEAPDWQKESLIQGVKHEGWIYGLEKNPIMKTHPCMVEYDDLPEQQKAKDHIFSAIAGTLLKQHRS